MNITNDVTGKKFHISEEPGIQINLAKNKLYFRALWAYSLIGILVTNEEQ
jgi:hypothetical protein